MVTSPEVMNDDDPIRKILLQVCQTGDGITEFDEALGNADLNAEIHLEHLVYVKSSFPAATTALNSLLNWGGGQDRLKLIVELCNKEKAARNKATSTSTQPARDIYRLILADILNHFPDEIECENGDKDNVLHIATREGTEDIVKELLQLILSIHDENTLDRLIQCLNDNLETPLRIAIYKKDVPKMQILAPYDDNRRVDHILEVVKLGKLELLEELLKGRRDWKELLDISVLSAAVKNGHENVFLYITNRKQGLANNAAILHLAIESCRLPIVKYLLDNHSDLLTIREASKSAAEIAVGRAEREAKEGNSAKARKASKLLQKEKTYPARDIKSLILDKMVRLLSPYQIKMFWPKNKAGQASEVCLDLNITNIRNWASIVRFITTAQEEVKALLLKHEKEASVEQKQDAENEQFSNGQTTHTFLTVATTPDVKQVNPPKTSSHHTSSYSIGFHAELKYVAFPDLDEFRRHCSATELEALAGTEVKHVLDWLRLIKGVEKVLELRVLDSRYHPHSEETIEGAIKYLKVEELNWKRVDLSIIAVRAASESIKKLHLYSSGCWTPLYHWMGLGGLDTLDLEDIRISIIQDNLTPTRAAAQKTEMEKWLTEKWSSTKKLSAETNKGTNPSVKDEDAKVKCVDWVTAGPSTMHNTTPAVSRDPQTVTKLQNFVNYYRQRQRRRLHSRDPALRIRRIKVAVIDTGFDGSDFGTELGQFKGDTFVHKGDTESHWWLSSDAHGTQMVRIINSIDPFCELYIAKVGDDKHDIRVERVTEALNTATDAGVDVISMSFALDSHDPTNPDLARNTALEQAVLRSSGVGTVLVCSTADEGNSKLEVWPAKCEGTLTIAACDENGRLAPYSSPRAKYLFQGEKIVPDGFRFADSKEEMSISGSSVATAIAAGVASLTLACLQIDGTPAIELKRNIVVKEMFEEMKGKETGSRCIRPWVVFGEDPRADGSMILPKDKRKD